MKTHSELFKDEDWDILIILDACRYDTFIKVCDPQLRDIVSPVNSEAPATVRWLWQHWNNSYDDIIYISGNPYINSRGVNTNLYDASKHFYKVIDSWDIGFDKKEGNVMPVAVYFDYLFNMDSDKKFIVHFMQPHAPYIFKKNKYKFTIYGILKRIIPLKYHNLLFIKFKKALPNPNKFRTTKKYPDLYSDDEIADAYAENLRYVLPYVYNIIKKTHNKTIIVTSDHSEYLGENGRYGHGGELNKLITTVPYLVVRT